MRAIFDKMSALYATSPALGDGGQEPIARALKACERQRFVASATARVPTLAEDSVLPAPHVARAQARLLALLGSKGYGKEYVQEELLQAIGAAADPGSIPFWLALLRHTVERDGFKTKRDEHALSALALLALAHRDGSALALLLEALSRDNPMTRGIAAQLLVLAHPAPGYGIADDVEPDEEKPAFQPPPETVAAILEVARGKGFEARFLARRALEWAGAEVPRDAPDGVFTFEIRPRHQSRVLRVIEIHSSQGLDRLGSALLDSLGWDHDHLFAFSFGKDHSFTLPPPEFDQTPDDGLIAVGDVGMVVRSKFTYLYDFGDMNRFDMRLLSIAESASPRAKYPRVTQREGASPQQYGRGF